MEPDSNEIEELTERGFTLDDENNKVKEFNANYFAEYIKSRYKLLFTKENYFFSYTEGRWVKKEDYRVLHVLREILQAPRFGVWTLKREKEYVEAIKRTLYFDQELNPYKNYINMLNGMFDLDKFELVEHHPEYYSTIQIPVEFDPYAECPRFMKYLEEVFEGDKERIALSQEWAGYSLTTETKAQKCLILIGNGANGKGIFVQVLSELIGEENISNIPLNELSKGFSRVCLYNITKQQTSVAKMRVMEKRLALSISN